MHQDPIKEALLESYRSHGGTNHLDGSNLPSQESVNQLAVDCMHLLFPGFFEDRGLTMQDLSAHAERLLLQIDKRLVAEIEKCLRFAKTPGAAALAREHASFVLGQ